MAFGSMPSMSVDSWGNTFSLSQRKLIEQILRSSISREPIWTFFYSREVMTWFLQREQFNHQWHAWEGRVHVGA